MFSLSRVVELGLFTSCSSLAPSDICRLTASSISGSCLSVLTFSCLISKLSSLSLRIAAPAACWTMKFCPVSKSLLNSVLMKLSLVGLGPSPSATSCLLRP
uniref:(northern house mosquito) hypothetical protein n=1 Tax=Culex pipiens TaxID=7175 RepID=A0A8D8NNI1_CULPI